MTTERGAAGATLLIVEDDRVINDGLAARLSAEGFTVAQAYDLSLVTASRSVTVDSLTCVDESAGC